MSLLGGLETSVQKATMKHTLEPFFRITLLAPTLLIWLWALNQPLSNGINLSIIVGCILLVFPIVWLGRKALDGQPTASRAVWITLFVHYALVILFGSAIIRAVTTHREWSGWTLPIPVEIGLLLVVITSIAALSTVANLALKGLGAPFAIALSRKLAVEWWYAWTRNPMVLTTLALLLSTGIWFQSVLFVLWVLILVTPALLVFVKLYEERELEIRFGTSYLEYKSRTPMLFPRKPGR
jgi:protein-S-isoprenylcysteine O-methyltransferase Ste14